MECADNEDGGVLSGECARKKGLLAKTCPRRSADPMSSVEKLKARGPVKTVYGVLPWRNGALEVVF